MKYGENNYSETACNAHPKKKNPQKTKTRVCFYSNVKLCTALNHGFISIYFRTIFKNHQLSKGSFLINLWLTITLNLEKKTLFP